MVTYLRIKLTGRDKEVGGKGRNMTLRYREHEYPQSLKSAIEWNLNHDKNVELIKWEEEPIEEKAVQKKGK